MKISEYVKLDGTALAELVAAKEVTAGELARTALAAASRINPAINAVVELFEDAPTAAHAASGPLAGVPFLLKDFAVMAEGRRQEMGSRLMSGLTMPVDSHLMTRFRGAGLIAVGRTATPEFAYNVSTEPLHGGAVRNPWNPEFMAGGSSGGSAAAVAAGIVPMAHATDGGGSIRLPASCCGVFGLKPSRGRISPAPYVTDPLAGFGVEFIVSRSVRDSAVMLDAVEGPAPGDRLEIARPSEPFTDALLRPPVPLKIGFTSQSLTGRPTDAACRAAVSETARLCADLGHDVEEVALTLDFDRLLDAVLVIWAAELAQNIDEAARMMKRHPGPDTLEATTLATYRHGQALSATDYLNALAALSDISRELGPLFVRYDALLTPTCAKVPQLLGTYDANDGKLSAADWVRHIFDFGSYTLPWNITGQPAMSLPLSHSPSGLPIGSQFIGRFAGEAMLLALAGQIEVARPWRNRQPLACSMPT